MPSFIKEGICLGHVRGEILEQTCSCLELAEGGLGKASEPNERGSGRSRSLHCRRDSRRCNMDVPSNGIIIRRYLGAL